MMKNDTIVFFYIVARVTLREARVLFYADNRKASRRMDCGGHCNRRVHLRECCCLVRGLDGDTLGIGFDCLLLHLPL